MPDTITHARARRVCLARLRVRLADPDRLDQLPDIFLILIDRALDMNLREIRRFANLGLDARLPTETPP